MTRRDLVPGPGSTRPGRPMAAALLVCAAAMLPGGCQRNARPDNANPRNAGPVLVSVAAVEKKDVPVLVRAIGGVEALASVTIRSHVAAILEEVYVTEGAEVPAGAPLFQFDCRAAQAAVDQAQANLEKDSADWKAATAEAARVQLALEGRAATQTDRDIANAKRDSLAAAMRGDEASLRNARVQLSYHRITAPMTAVAGDLNVHKGDVVKVDDTPMITLRQIRPIYVTFTVPEVNLPAIREHQGRLLGQLPPADQAFAGLPVRACAPGQEPDASVGYLAFIDNAVDPNAGTIRLRGLFANEDRRLWPGQFVNVALTLVPHESAVCAPARAVQAGQSGQFVYVLKPDGTVRRQEVRVEREFDGQVVIQSGLTGGETVVTDGQLQLVDGTAVELRRDVTSAPATKEAHVK